MVISSARSTKKVAGKKVAGASALSASSCNTYLKGGGGVIESGISSLLFKGAFPFLPLFSFLYQELFYTKAI